MKKKSLAALLSGFLTVCLTGVGFASWLITGGDTETYNDGSISVEAVSDKRTKIESVSVKAGSNSTIVFGPNDEAKNDTTSWLRADAATENLSFTLQFTVANAKRLSAINVEVKEIKAVSGDTITYYGAEEGKYYAAYSAKYVAALPTPTVTLGDLSTLADDASKTFECTVTFNWGEFFDQDGTPDTNVGDNLNPYAFFNQSGKTASTHGDAALAALAALTALTALNGATFGVIITTVSA